MKNPATSLVCWEQQAGTSVRNAGKSSIHSNGICKAILGTNHTNAINVANNFRDKEISSCAFALTQKSCKCTECGKRKTTSIAIYATTKDKKLLFTCTKVERSVASPTLLFHPAHPTVPSSRRTQEWNYRHDDAHLVCAVASYSIRR